MERFHPPKYRIAGNFRCCKFSHKLEFPLIKLSKFPGHTHAASTRTRITLTHTTVQGTLRINFCKFLFSHMQHALKLCENLHHSKISRYTVLGNQSTHLATLLYTYPHLHATLNVAHLKTGGLGTRYHSRKRQYTSPVK